MIDRLGGGVFGDTYMCEWKDRQVAAKRIAVGIHQGQMSTEDHQWLVRHVFRLRWVDGLVTTVTANQN